MAKGTKRAELPKAPRAENLPALPEGQEWHEYEAAGYLWTIAEPTTLAGALRYCGANIPESGLQEIPSAAAALVVDRFNRGERINRSAKLDIRRKVLDAKNAGKLPAVLESLANAQATFDTTTVQPRAPRVAPKVSEKALADAMASGDISKVQALLKAAGVKVTE